MCEAGLLTHGIEQAGFILMDFVGKTILVEDRELIHCFLPITAGPTPVPGDVPQSQSDQL